MSLRAEGAGSNQANSGLIRPSAAIRDPRELRMVDENRQSTGFPTSGMNEVGSC
jgi:hypothetical protein